MNKRKKNNYIIYQKIANILKYKIKKKSNKSINFSSSYDFLKINKLFALIKIKRKGRECRKSFISLTQHKISRRFNMT
jgi:hypothetical protein